MDGKSGGGKHSGSAAFLRIVPANVPGGRNLPRRYLIFHLSVVTSSAKKFPNTCLCSPPSCRRTRSRQGGSVTAVFLSAAHLFSPAFSAKLLSRRSFIFLRRLRWGKYGFAILSCGKPWETGRITAQINIQTDGMLKKIKIL